MTPKSEHPRICQALGVEGEDCEGCLHEDKRAVGYPCSVCSLAYSSRYESKPRFTEEEMVLAGILLRHGATALYRKEGRGLYWRGKQEVGKLPMMMFPGVQVGEEIGLEAIIGTAK